MADFGIFRGLLGVILRLPPRQTGRLTIERDIPVAMRDGAILLADRHVARTGAPGPVILMRCPYGRGAIFGMVASLLAERGFQVILQSVRGTAGSGGEFNPMRQEQVDGADTLDWVKAQPWCSGPLFTFGWSYLGNAQWAMANGCADKMDGLALVMTLSNFGDELIGTGAFTQGGMLGWSQTVQMMAGMEPGKKLARPKPDSLNAAHGHLPMGTLDQAAFGKTLPWWRDWMAHDDPADPWWSAIDHSAAVAELTAPTTMVAGWQDIFLPFQIKDFEARQAAGRDAWLTVGPWSHSSPGGVAESLRQTVALFKALANGQQPYAERDRVRLFLQGANVWRDYPSWPPPGATALRYHLRSGSRLEPSPPSHGEGSSSYIYDPANPTPAIHGPMVMGGAKVRDMRALEQRSDTIVFTSPPLDWDLDVIGPVAAELAVRSSREHTDFYVCLCDLDSKGRSIQVADGFVRLRPGQPEADAAGVRRIAINCWPTAYRFKRGHSLRLIIASGAHPRYARNLGTGEPAATGTKMVAASQEVLHDGMYVSAINLLGVGS